MCRIVGPQVKMKKNNMDISFAHQVFIDNQFMDASNGDTYNTINPTDESVGYFEACLCLCLCLSVSSRPDMTCAVDWALNNYLSVSVSLSLSLSHCLSVSVFLLSL